MNNRDVTVILMNIRGDFPVFKGDNIVFFYAKMFFNRIRFLMKDQGSIMEV